MSATKIGNHFDFAREQHETAFVEAHQDLLYELSRRLGVLVGQKDKQGLALMAAALHNISQQAFEQYQAKHGAGQGEG